MNKSFGLTWPKVLKEEGDVFGISFNHLKIVTKEE